jgi:hypothetical protein
MGSRAVRLHDAFLLESLENAMGQACGDIRGLCELCYLPRTIGIHEQSLSGDPCLAAESSMMPYIGVGPSCARVLDVDQHPRQFDMCMAASVYEPDTVIR